MTLADDAIVSKLTEYVLDPAIVEGAIVDGLAELRPARDVLEARRAALQSEIRTVEEEQAKFVAATAVAEQVDALAGALRDREHQRSRLRAELAMLEGNDQFSSFDIRRVERDLRERLGEWRGLLRREAPIARQIITVLLDGRIVCTPYKDERCYAFAGRVKFDALLSGAGAYARDGTGTGIRYIP